MKTKEEWRPCSGCGVVHLLPFYEGHQAGDSRGVKNGYWGKCSSCRKTRYQKWRSTKPLTYEADRKRLKIYGLRPSDVHRMLVNQNFICPICDQEIDRHAHVDHDHLTGAIRGLLCAPCNKGLGHFRDDPKVITKALEYLERTFEGVMP